MPLAIPARGLEEAQIFRTLDELKRDDADYEHGRTFSLVYYADAAHQRLLDKAYTKFAATNAQNPMAFSSLRRMEAEVVRMTAALLHGGRDAVGTMTSGGTESILLAVKAARDRARAEKPKIIRPNIVAPETIHASIDKAAEYLGLEMRYARLGDDLRADVRDMAALIDANTVLIAASAPQYPHGVVDPMEEIAELALRKKIPFHVDACVGGFLLPWVERLGHPVPLWDFRVPGVTSISADVHKYGFATKGSSTILYRDMSYLRYQFFVSTDWPGGIYASPSALGTRGGGAIAAAWTSIVAMGQEGFLAHTEKAMKAAQTLIAGIEENPQLEVMGRPDATLVAWRTKKSSGLDVYVIADRLEDRDWSIDRQQNPPSIHCTITSNHAPIISEYLRDVREAVSFVQSHPELQSRGSAAMYGMIAKVPFRGMVKKSALEMLERLYGPDAANAKLDLFGQEGDDGLVMRLAKNYGNRALDLLDRVDGFRHRLGLTKKRRVR
jgi:glutamate/tyrosine decarboxylase-like PLP-dependent enzyme